MKREIKFRAWVYNDAKWSGTKEIGMFTGFTFSDIESGREESNVYCDDSRIIEEPQWDKIVIMQYTGLKDGEGKDIYEGDIVKFLHKEERILNIGEISFEDGSFIVKEKTGAFYMNAPFNILEVIGNIYENPELL